MIKITKEELDKYIEIANKEQTRIGLVIDGYMKKKKEVPANILQEFYMVKRVLRELEASKKSNPEMPFIDYNVKLLVDKYTNTQMPEKSKSKIGSK